MKKLIVTLFLISLSAPALADSADSQNYIARKQADAEASRERSQGIVSNLRSNRSSTNLESTHPTEINSLADLEPAAGNSGQSTQKPVTTTSSTSNGVKVDKGTNSATNTNANTQANANDKPAQTPKKTQVVKRVPYAHPNIKPAEPGINYQ